MELVTRKYFGVCVGYVQLVRMTDSYLTITDPHSFSLPSPTRGDFEIAPSGPQEKQLSTPDLEGM
jgi:hypothetical protein